MLSRTRCTWLIGGHAGCGNVSVHQLFEEESCWQFRHREGHTDLALLIDIDWNDAVRLLLFFIFPNRRITWEIVGVYWVCIPGPW